MNKANSKNLFVKAASFLSVASLSVLISLPGLSQKAPDNTNPNVPSTTKPTNPGGSDAGTTNGGENLNRVPTVGNDAPSNGSTMQRNGGSMEGQMGGTSNSSDPINRVEGRDQGTQGEMNSSPNGSNGQRGTNQPGANQPGATTGGDSSQQVEQNRGSMQRNGSSMQRNGGSMQQNGGSMQRTQMTPQNSGQNDSQQGMPQSGNNSGSTTDGQSTTQEPSNGSVRALW